MAKAFSSRTWLVIDHGQATPQTTAIQASGREATYTPQAIRYSKGGYKEGTFNPNQRSAKGEIKEYTNDLDPHGPHETNSSRTTRTHRIPAPLWTCYSLRDGPVLTSTALLRSIKDQSRQCANQAASSRMWNSVVTLRLRLENIGALVSIRSTLVPLCFSMFGTGLPGQFWGLPHWSCKHCAVRMDPHGKYVSRTRGKSMLYMLYSSDMFWSSDKRATWKSGLSLPIISIISMWFYTTNIPLIQWIHIKSH